jgi:hypothetical protein
VVLTSVDGGVSILAKLNGQEICKSEAMYGTNAVKNLDGESWLTIQSMSVCGQEPIKLKKGDTVSIEANYDFELHPRYRHSTNRKPGFANVSLDANNIMVV